MRRIGSQRRGQAKKGHCIYLSMGKDRASSDLQNIRSQALYLEHTSCCQAGGPHPGLGAHRHSLLQDEQDVGSWMVLSARSVKGFRQESNLLFQGMEGLHRCSGRLFCTAQPCPGGKEGWGIRFTSFFWSPPATIFCCSS